MMIMYISFIGLSLGLENKEMLHECDNYLISYFVSTLWVKIGYQLWISMS